MNEFKKGIEKIALSIRSLTIDAIEKATSGHPGLPLGMAEALALLFAEILKHNPQDPNWPDRDRFVLSAGHGSMLLYSLLFLSGYDLKLEDIKQFRQLHSRTPGHPEKGITPGVETTTGPLGQGLANAVGMAIAEQMLAAQFNTPEYKIVDHFTYVLAGDGCLMEGVAAEACSLAGHLKLGKLIVFYDSNKITIDGSTELAFSEDVALRFKAYGWDTYQLNAYDLEGIRDTILLAKQKQERPTLLILDSIIGKGSVSKAGSEKCHGSPLGPEEAKLTKKALGLKEDEYFYIAPESLEYFENKLIVWKKNYSHWQKNFANWQKAYPELSRLWENYWTDSYSKNIEAFLPKYSVGQKIATRDSNGVILNIYAEHFPQLVGGSADLASSNKTRLIKFDDFLASKRHGRNINFGVREHAMGAIVNGLALHGGLRPYCATFFVFSDYMRPAIRLAAIMKLPVIYFFTHDSIYVGEDGSTHQPVEHLAALRAIPELEIWRPADAEENKEIFPLVLHKKDGPVALILSRQNLTVFAKEDSAWKQNLNFGAYLVKKSKNRPKISIIATGSEVNTALEAEKLIGRDDIQIISMPCRERFLQLPAKEREKFLPENTKVVVIEAGVSLGWEGLLGKEGLFIGLASFGLSGKAEEVSDFLGLNPQKIAAKIKELF